MVAECTFAMNLGKHVELAQHLANRDLARIGPKHAISK